MDIDKETRRLKTSSSGFPGEITVNHLLQHRKQLVNLFQFAVRLSIPLDHIAIKFPRGVSFVALFTKYFSKNSALPAEAIVHVLESQ